jgi:vesicle coat complex subunit
VHSPPPPPRSQPDPLQDADLTSKIQRLLTDRDAQVVANCVCALRELCPDFNLTKPLVIMLLKRFRDFNEWSQCLILDFIASFRPEKDDVFEVLVGPHL